MIKKYSNKFYADVDSRANESAKEILDVVNEYIDFSGLDVVVDIGCGSGAWLNAFLLQSNAKIYGYDLIDSVAINKNRFTNYLGKRISLIACDFEQLASLKLPSADLGICLEVLEHLENETGKKIVEQMANSCEVILFSAATPGQGGTGHINEKKHQYWLNQFEEKGFKVYDCVRPSLQKSTSTARYYALNTFLLVKSRKAVKRNLINLETTLVTDEIADFRNKLEKLQFYFLRFLPSSVVTQLSKILSH